MRHCEARRRSTFLPALCVLLRRAAPRSKWLAAHLRKRTRMPGTACRATTPLAAALPRHVCMARFRTNTVATHTRLRSYLLWRLMQPLLSLVCLCGKTLALKRHHALVVSPAAMPPTTRIPAAADFPIAATPSLLLPLCVLAGCSSGCLRQTSSFYRVRAATALWLCLSRSVYPGAPYPRGQNFTFMVPSGWRAASPSEAATNGAAALRCAGGGKDVLAAR